MRVKYSIIFCFLIWTGWNQKRCLAYHNYLNHLEECAAKSHSSRFNCCPWQIIPLVRHFRRVELSRIVGVTQGSCQRCIFESSIDSKFPFGFGKLLLLVDQKRVLGCWLRNPVEVLFDFIGKTWGWHFFLAWWARRWTFWGLHRVGFEYFLGRNSWRKDCLEHSQYFFQQN